MANCTETGKTSLVVTTKPVVSYRIKRIDVQTRESITQIKFTYDDDTTWCCGPDGGTKDKRAIIMTENEHLVRVTHECLYSHTSAGASVEFETSKGRVLKYKPGKGWRGIATDWKSEKTEIKAEPGMEIISLIIKRGTLVGSHQQKSQTSNVGGYEEWYTYCYTAIKEDADSGVIDELNNNGEFIYEQFDSKLKALKTWKSSQEFLKTKKGRAGILIDSRNGTVIKKIGDGDLVDKCLENATSKGFYVQPAEEEMSLFHVMWTLYLTTVTRKDIGVFVIGILAQVISNYLSIHGRMISGDILALLVSNQTDQLQQNIYINITCTTFRACDLNDNVSLCKALLIAAFLVKMMCVFFRMVSTYINHVVNKVRELKVDDQILSHVMEFDQSFFDTHSTSHIHSSMRVRSIFNMFNYHIPGLITNLSSFVITLYYLLSIDVYVGGFAVIVTIVGYKGIVSKVFKSFQTSHKYQWKWEMAMSEIRGAMIGNFTLVKYFSTEKKHLEEYREVRKKREDTFHTHVFYDCFYDLVSTLMSSTVFSGCIFICLHYILHSGMTTSQLTSFFFLLEQLRGVTNSLIRQDDWMRNTFKDLDRYVRLKQEKPKMKKCDKVLTDFKGGVVFKDVHFSYPSRPTEPVLKGLNMVIEQNKMTAIVGESGAGKSTISKLMMRLYDPFSGSILIDGYDIQSIDLKDLHRHMAIVAQNPRLLGTTIAENIHYGSSKDDIDMDEVKKAAVLANCQFVDKFRAGYDTYAGGEQLSGGQKQRIAIARAAIRNPKLLILDEATSSLDAENESDVQEALENVMKGRTIVVIAHRLSTIRNADRIICMKEGQLAEQGTHDELMEKKGVYYNLISKQIDGEAKKDK